LLHGGLPKRKNILHSSRPFAAGLVEPEGGAKKVRRTVLTDLEMGVRCAAHFGGNVGWVERERR
jgi:hypothetical protein